MIDFNLSENDHFLSEIDRSYPEIKNFNKILIFPAL